MQNTEPRSLSFIMYQFKIKMYPKNNVKTEILNLLEDTPSETLDLIDSGKDFLNRTSIAQERASKISK